MGDDVMIKDGCMRSIKPMNGTHYTMLELESMVGGNVEFLRLSKGWVLAIDQDGKMKGRLPNRIATGFILRDGYQDFIAGTALLIDSEHISLT